ncbi:selenocysteine-specific translation elongation factor [Natronosporangium hydrolyticum]|uniref:Selenocysteine-specific elongation factor n=1 Tax=Natronosporangium hydrolyticum TaxID=2811111 RepID=A0A895YGD3_9ACTN|nr:selenocysteine-specific translation elongation factor [Natronosporangium hydrolyticum]QSB12748.1 selenocysteine-specific translation elongation factor [Natronosporangium hydrolyticum]
MLVVATAGHVDHGKSTLVRALTGMEPDRWEQERRRGLTIDLGFAWTDLPTGETVAFVDVPGHERFVPNMLAGVGPVPAVLLVVAADEGWMPQSAEHLAALDGLGVRHGVLVVTRTDLAEPAAAVESARAALAGTSLAGLAAAPVLVSAPAGEGPAGEGLVQLRAALARLAAAVPPAETSAPVRLWVDRVFTIHGSGTVLTGTLPAGTLRVGDELALASSGRPVRVRGLQALGGSVAEISGVARVAVNLRGIDRGQVRRGDALVCPGGFQVTGLVDVRVTGDPATALPGQLQLHVGAAAVPVRVRPLGADTARLRLARPLPLHVGDRGLLRDPGRNHIAGGVRMLDVAPPEMPRRRGAAAARAALLAELDGAPDLVSELRRRRLIRRTELVTMGVPAGDMAAVAGDWLADRSWWRAQQDRLRELVEAHQREQPLDGGLPSATAARQLGLPDRALVVALATEPLTLRDGRVTTGAAALPEPLRLRTEQLLAELAGAPFQAPASDQLAALGLGAAELAAAERAGLLLRLADQVVVAPDAAVAAVAVLAELPQPFTLSQARRALSTTRRVAVPLLELLDRRGETRRLVDDRRHVVAAGDG